MRPGIHGLFDVAASPAGWWALLLVILLPTVACSQESPTSGLVVSSDAALQETANALLEDVSERSGLSFTRPVRVEWRSEEELVRYLTFKLDEEFQEGEVERIRDSYALLGLVPETLDLGALFLALYTEQVAGFYDPDSVALYVRSGQDEETVESVLVHELVHAAQDQSVDLDALTARSRGNDRQIAAQAAAEGHATLVMLEYALEKQQGVEVDLVAIPDFIDLMGPSLAAAASSSPVLSTAPGIVRESLIFPYVQGTEYVRVLWQRRRGSAASVRSAASSLHGAGAGTGTGIRARTGRAGRHRHLRWRRFRDLHELARGGGDRDSVRRGRGGWAADIATGRATGSPLWRATTAVGGWSGGLSGRTKPRATPSWSRGQAVAAALTDATLEPAMLDGRYSERC